MAASGREVAQRLSRREAHPAPKVVGRQSARFHHDPRVGWWRAVARLTEPERGCGVHADRNIFAMQVTVAAVDEHVPALALMPRQMTNGVGVAVVSVRVRAGVHAPRAAVVIQSVRTRGFEPRTALRWPTGRVDTV
jgi:hypothetical protein